MHKVKKQSKTEWSCLLLLVLAPGYHQCNIPASPCKAISNCGLEASDDKWRGEKQNILSTVLTFVYVLFSVLWTET